jgi:CubicO group peptidase (beta-lactamase class C family)
VTAVDTARIDEMAARFFARGGQPGLAYGIVADGELVHAGGLGEMFAGSQAPAAGTIFRIASMTKSFTASVIMMLRDEGALRLDDPAEAYVPELSGVRPLGPDCPAVTIRHLLTMTSGFPTDDPWGDRQQGLPIETFGVLLAEGGVRYAWAPGTRFEYSNLGYAVLGRVITALTGLRYERAMRERLLRPLGLDRTGFDAAEFDPAELARGHQHDDEEGWRELQPDPSGAFAPMGGIFSCVSDLARWVAGFAAAFPAGDTGPATGEHPVSRATRREMQLGQVGIPGEGDTPAARLRGPAAISYGFGLFAEDDPAFGPIVQHSGGYPGYGSHMRWHPPTGLGAIALGNGTYAKAGALAGELLATVLATDAAASRRSVGYVQRGPVPVPQRPWAETLAARDSVNALLQEWDEADATRLFTANVALDRPLVRRRADIEHMRQRIGEFRPDAGRAAECDSPAHCRWWVTGENGSVCVQIKLAPLVQPLVQQLIVAVPPAADSALMRAVELLTEAINAGTHDWPADLDTTLSTYDTLRQLRLARAWAGWCDLTGWLAGDGTVSATAELAGPDGRVGLAVDVGANGDGLVRTEISLLAPR